MRIISGCRRGMKLFAPDGMDTRPTTDRVKESLFNIIQFRLPCDKVLDLFAGSGSLGIECISRYCGKCTFVDSNKQSLALVQKNVKSAQFEDSSSFFNTDAISFLTGCNDSFDLIFLDPPYNCDFLEPAIELIHRRNILNENGIIVVESEKNGESVPDTYFPIRRQATYGKTVITILQG